MAAKRSVPSASRGPLLTQAVVQQMRQAADAGARELRCSLDLGRSEVTIEVHESGWQLQDQRFPYPEPCRERTIYFWDGSGFEPAARFDGGLIKLVPTEWGVPTFEIDGIKMLPTAALSPFEDARTKVAWIEPRGKRILDCCAGLGYFAANCLEAGAQHIRSYEKNSSVLWLRSINPWSPGTDARLDLALGDISEQIKSIESGSIDAILHDPPRFGIAGELYSQVFYDELARVISRRGLLFHYTGTPNKLTSGRDVPQEVAARLRRAGFRPEMRGDGILGKRL